MGVLKYNAFRVTCDECGEEILIDDLDGATKYPDAMRLCRGKGWAGTTSYVLCPECSREYRTARELKFALWLGKKELLH